MICKILFIYDLKILLLPTSDGFPYLLPFFPFPGRSGGGPSACGVGGEKYKHPTDKDIKLFFGLYLGYLL